MIGVVTHGDIALGSPVPRLGMRRGPKLPAIETIAKLGLSAGLVLCLDPGDADSYDGSSQQWTDTSGQDNHFNRGSTSGADTTDPSFTGSAGALTSYFSTDGGDFFTPAGAPTFDDEWPQDGAAFTIAGMFYLPSAGAGTTRQLFGNSALTSHNGVRLTVASNNRLRLTQVNGDGPSAQNFDSVATVAHDAWNFLAVAHDEGGGAAASTAHVNTTSRNYDGAYSAPTSGTAEASPQIFGIGGTATSGAPGSGTRLGPLMMWSRALSAPDLARLSGELRRRYGTP